MSRGRSHRAVKQSYPATRFTRREVRLLITFHVLALISAIVFIVALTPHTGASVLTAFRLVEIAPQTVEPNALERLTNEQREAHDLPALATHELLRQSACHKAADMVKHDYFAHVAPDGTEPWHYFREAGYTYQHAGENLARNFTEDAALVQTWMDSPTHRDNVLGDFEEQGICSVEGVTVQHLGVGA
ncbi:CAP domain-containing protein [Dietzia natronolimnaea]|uniref:CAP domain-containing protein n=1 Tax=Dietzia natronolimnaea TaxID=161920 RepID=UPI0015FBA6EA|nr:CAP domain-containing protein [Dietzia natronolimnaea]MBB1037375.1 hypothetical protein [Dietzia natronolimnaea]